ncbi:MAG: nuclease-related domain-containing protein [Metamycoplasmataceae bacterium]
MASNEIGFLIGIIIGTIFLISILGLLLFFYFKNRKIENVNKKIGNASENKVNKLLKKWAIGNNGKYLEDSLYKYNGNILFEVDGILITTRALICIEVKAINGKIEGNALEDKWFKVMGNNRHEIKNPIIQNEKHIAHILKITKTKVPMLSLIIFDDERTNDINISNKPSHVIVIKFSDLEATLDEINKSLLPKLNNNEIYNIFNLLKEASTNTKEDKNLFKSYFNNEKNN